MNKHPSNRILFFKFILVGFFCMGFNVYAQQLGFEWIRKYQPYYKFKITQQGLYRIDSAGLAASGISLINVDPKRFQVFRNGIEQAIFIKGQSDGVFNSTDFLELVAEPNDGKLDQELYRTPIEQPHNLRSLFSDTAYYFLTVLPDTSVQTGKRFLPFTDNDYSSFTPEPYYETEQFIAPQEDYYYGTFVPASTKYYLSEYGDAEGMISSLMGLGEQKNYTFKTPNAANLQNAYLEIKVVGSSDFFLNDPNLPNHHIKVFVSQNGISPVLVIDSTFRGYGEHFWVRNLSSGLIGDSTIINIQVVNDLSVGSDFIGISYIKLNYIRSNQAANKPDIIWLKNPVPAAKTLIQFNNYSKSNPLLLDLTNDRRVEGFKSGNLFNALLPYNSLRRQLLVVDETEILLFPALSPVVFPQINPGSNYEYLIISHPLLANAALDYQTYRSKKYNTLLTYSEDLFDYYTYGNPHPLAIRRFCRHLYTVQSTKPKFLMLLGRGYQNNLIKTSAANFALNLVPAIGVPSSDNLFTNGFEQNTGAPSIATGRVPAASNQEALNYLDKVKYYETNPDSIQIWRKNYLHLSGGDDINFQTQFRNQLNSIAGFIKNKPIGANINAYYKTSTAPVQPDLKGALVDKLNSGINLMTFYGHGSLSVLDMDFGSIGDLKTTNRYTFYYFNGCNIGNASDVDPLGSGLIYGKDYLCAQSKGAIGWLAHSNLTFTNNLEIQMNRFYSQMSGPGYGLPVGINLKNALEITSASNDVFSRSHALQLMYQGDPAIVLYAPALADYEIQDADLFISPANATVQNDSLAIGVIIKNLAKATGDTITIHCNRTLPDNKTITYPGIKITAPFYLDTFYFWIRSLNKTEIGENKFNIQINRDHVAGEINFGNNDATISYFIPGSGIQALMPYNYAIVNKDTVEFIVQNNNLSASKVSCIFEIDTSLNFSPASSFFDSVEVTGSSLISWKKKIPVTDSMVFYWRSRLNVPEKEGGVWVTQSFTHIIDGPQGWRQSKYEQIKNVSARNFIQFNDSLQKIEFADNELALGIENKRWDHSNMGVIIPYRLNAAVGACIPGGVVVLVFEPFQVEFPYELPNYPFNCAYVQANKQSQSVRYYPFNTNTTQGETELKRLIDSVPNGYIVAMFSRYETNIENWNTNTKTLFQSIGSYKVAQVKSYHTAWAVIGKKGDLMGSAAEDTMYYPTTSSDTSFKVTKYFTFKWHQGDFTSALAGPAKSYQEAQIHLIDEDKNPTGRWWWQINGVSKDGKDSVLFQNITAKKIALNTIDAKLFPNLKLQLFNIDSNSRTPLQFGNWQVNFEPATEVSVEKNNAFSFYKELIDQGDTLQFTLPIKNIGYSAFDSSLLSVEITDENRAVKYKLLEKIGGIEAGNTILLKKKIATNTLNGKQRLTVKINSDKQVPEINYNNNFYDQEFTVKADDKSPFLDVTFDGQRIFNRDIVSPNPIIRISSSDQNKFLLQNDTGTFALFFKTPDSDFERIHFTDAMVQFFPATDKQNTALLQYSPTHLKDGKYYTLKVQASDASGNKAGANEYSVDFEVINKTSITHFYPYPNPFTTSMRFVFTLTGSKVPDQLMVRILTISGRIVREIRKDEFGPIHIGNNISEFTWDGTDQYGDRLANGVYLYQVYTRIEGNELENRKTSAKEESSFFTGKTGKIYLMR